MEPDQGFGDQQSICIRKAGWLAHLPLWVVVGLGAVVMLASEEPAIASLGDDQIAVGKVTGYPATGVGSYTDPLGSFTLTDLGAAPSETRIKPYAHDLSIANTDPRRVSALDAVGLPARTVMTPELAQHASVGGSEADPIVQLVAVRAHLRPVRPVPPVQLAMLGKELPLIVPDVQAFEPVDPNQVEPVKPIPKPLTVRQQQDNITKYLARFYRRDADKIRRYVRYAYQSGKRNDVDPLLIIGVMCVESSLNPKALSHKGAKGLMQVLVRAHKKRFKQFGGTGKAFDPRVSIEVGTRILAGMIVRDGDVPGALKRYVGAAYMKSDFGYGAKVIGMRERIYAASIGEPVPRKPDTKAATRRANLAQAMLNPALKSARR